MSSGAVDLATFRRARNVVTAKQVAVITAGLILASQGRAAGDGISAALLHLMYIIPLTAPGALCALGKPRWLAYTYTLGNLTISLLNVIVARGVLPSTEAGKQLFIRRLELVPELLISYNAQASLPVMAVLHALRQWSMCLLCAHCSMPAPDPCYSWHRWALHWLMLMLCQCGYELRTRYAYFKATRRREAAHAKDVASGVVVADASSAAQTKATPSGSEAAPSNVRSSDDARAARVVSDAGSAAGSGVGASGAGADIQAARGVPLPQLQPQLQQLGALAAASGPLARVEASAPGRAYRSKLLMGLSTVNLKLQDLRPEQLPAEFFPAFTKQLKPCMPGAHITNMAVRQGCVVLALDLLTSGVLGGGARGQLGNMSGLVRALSSTLVICKADRRLKDTSTLTAQTACGVEGFAWDSSAHEYVQSETVATQLAALLQLAALCQLASAAPVVVSLPSGNRKVQLQLQLTVPSRSRILGWQPADAAVSAEAQALALSSDVPQLDVLVLVRCQAGDYLPVTVSLMSQASAQCADGDTLSVSVQADVAVPCKEATGLAVELWAKAPATSKPRPELLVAHWPVLLLPADQQAAASELAQLVQGMGGVSAVRDLPSPDAADEQTDASLFLNDLGAWLGHAADISSGTVLEPQLVEHMAVLGTGLLVHCVQRGCAEAAQLIVSAMVQSSGAHAAGTSWFLAAAKPAGAEGEQHAPTPLLHAAMASGNADMLGKVLRWGQLYGGRQWRWPWSLTDSTGYTALHQAAAHPDASTCAALLATLKRMVPGEVPAAHLGWLHEQGTAGVTPSQLFTLQHPTYDTGMLWEQLSAAKVTAATPAQAAAGGSSRASAPGVGQAGAEISPEAAGATGSCAAASTAVGMTTPTAVPSFMSLMREAWRWQPAPEYDAWALRQVSVTVYSWAWFLVAICCISTVAIGQSGAWLPGFPCLLLHHVMYMVIVAMSLGVKKLGTWQTVMPLVPLFHCVAYACVSLFPVEAMPAYRDSVMAGGDIIYTMMQAPLEQNVLPFMALTRIVLAAIHVFAYYKAGLAFPVIYSIAMHTTAMLACTLVRTYQLRAYYRWLRSSASRDVSRKGTAAQATQSAATAEAEQHGKLKVQ